MLNGKKVSVVVPVYNSQECVETLVDRVNRSLTDVDNELILINDCSSDNSWQEIKKTAMVNQKVIGINIRKNSGQDNAIMAGFSRASGDYIVIMDDDLQHDPYAIKGMIQELESGDFDVCFANFLYKKQKWWKNLGSWFNGKMAEVIIKKPPDIYLSPFKVIRRAVINDIVEYKGPYPYIDGLIFTVTRNATQISVEHHNRFAGKSNYTVARSVTVWLKLMTSFSVFPLRIATVMGMMASVIGFLVAIFFFARYFISGEEVQGWTSLMIMMLILCGTILLALGAIGEYVGRAYIQLNQRPQYCIKEVLNGKL